MFPSSVQGEPGVRAELYAELAAVRDAVVGPDGMDPALCTALSLEDDAVEMCGAVYALPDQFRERGRSGTPLMWPWPWDLFQSGMARRDELLLAAAMLLIAVERIDRSASSEELRHLHVRRHRRRDWTEMIDRTLQQCWVAAVIRDDDGNVLVARWADTQAWDLPSETLRVGEDVCTGVRRVVADAVTLGVSVGWLAGIHSHVRDGLTLIFPGPVT